MNPARAIWLECYRLHRTNAAKGRAHLAAGGKAEDFAFDEDIDRFGSMNEIAIRAAYFRAMPVWRSAIHSAVAAFLGDPQRQAICLAAHRDALQRRTMDNRLRRDRARPEQKWYPATRFNRQTKV